MTTRYAALLAPEVVDQIKHLATAIRERELAVLIGAGTSKRRGLPSWGDLVKRLIHAWKKYESSMDVPNLHPEDYESLLRNAVGSDQDVASYLRHRADADGGPGFGTLLYEALYTSPSGRDFTPEPDHVHRHIVALFADYPGRIWTTNYDDLLKRAAELNGQSVRALYPRRHLSGAGLLVAHLHGFMPPRARAQGHPDPRHTQVILAEDDFHAIAADVIGWTNREFYRLFDDHRVLVLGMSLADPNMRRALMARPASSRTPASGEGRMHFALLRSIHQDEVRLTDVDADLPSVGLDLARRSRVGYWNQYGVELVEVPEHDDILPFLMRLRYESHGARSGDLWREGAKQGYDDAVPWRTDRQDVARRFLQSAAAGLREDFGVSDHEELVEIGIFLLQPDAKTLELVFRSSNAPHGPGRRTFSADPDQPTGLAGRVFVAGDLVRVPRSDPLHDYGLTGTSAEPSLRYEGIIACPIIDWARGGIPLGVVYATTARAEGTLFGLSRQAEAQAGAKSVDDLYLWLNDAALTLLSSWRS